MCDWLEFNKLSIHLGKTQSIIFQNRSKLSDCSVLNIERNGVLINNSKIVEYLGCLFDSDLSGESMAQRNLYKLNNRLKYLYRNKNYLSLNARRILCNALIQPIFDYASCVWYFNLREATKKKLQIIQNRCIRFCLDMNSREHISNSTFRKINWLPVKHRVDQCALTCLFNTDKGFAPNYMAETFCKIVPNRFTRLSQSSYLVPLVKLKAARNSTSFIASSQWNKLESFIYYVFIELPFLFCLDFNLM